MSWPALKDRLRTVLASLELRNLAENPSFETDDAGIALDAGLTKALDATQAHTGGQSLKVSGGAGSSKNVWATKIDGSRFAVEAGELYTWALSMKPEAGDTPPTLRLVLEWFDAGGGSLATLNGSLLPIGLNSDWARHSLTGAAPDMAATARVGVEEAVGWSAGRDMYLDALMFAKGLEAPYIDGAQPGCAWAGTPHASASTRKLSRVYLDPPGTVQDLPCAVIYPPAVEVERRPSDWNVRTYTCRVNLLFHDSDWATAALLADSFREVLVDALLAEAELKGPTGLMHSVRVEALSAFNYGRTLIGMDCFFPVRVG
jgi:hypothetical protein